MKRPACPTCNNIICEHEPERVRISAPVSIADENEVYFGSIRLTHFSPPTPIDMAKMQFHLHQNQYSTGRSTAAFNGLLNAAALTFRR